MKKKLLKFISAASLAVMVIGSTPLCAKADWKYDKVTATWSYNNYTGWKSIGGKWYFFDNNKRMKTGWLEDNGKKYYLGTDGVMVSRTSLTIDGQVYTFGIDGTLVTNNNSTLITAVQLNNIRPKKESKKTDAKMTVPQGAQYSVESLDWKRTDGKNGSFDVFSENGVYEVWVTLKANTGHKFNGLTNSNDNSKMRFNCILDTSIGVVEDIALLENGQGAKVKITQIKCADTVKDAHGNYIK